MPGVYLFDLDGTLIDSSESIASSCNAALASVGRPVLPVATISSFVGYGARRLIIRALGPEHLALVDDALAAFIAHYAAHPILGTRWMPGAREAIAAPGRARVGLVTNKARGVTIPVVRALGVEDAFGVITAGGDAPLKPDPALVVLALRALGAEPASTWMIGDGPQDIRAGKAAGCRTAAVLGGFHDEASLRAESPDRVLRSLEEL